MHIMLSFCFLMILFSSFMLYRNNIVYKERTRLLKEISNSAKQDIKKQRTGLWRSDALNNYSYNKMLWQLTKFHWELSEDGKSII